MRDKIKKDVERMFRTHSGLLETLTFKREVTDNTTRYEPASGVVAEVFSTIDIKGMVRNYNRSEVDGERIRTSDMEVTILLSDLGEWKPQIGDELVMRESQWSIRLIQIDQVSSVAIIQVRSNSLGQV